MQDPPAFQKKHVPTVLSAILTPRMGIASSLDCFVALGALAIDDFDVSAFVFGNF